MNVPEYFFFSQSGSISVPRPTRSGRRAKRNGKRVYHTVPPLSYWLEYSSICLPLAGNQYVELVHWKVIFYHEEPVCYHLASTGRYVTRAPPVDMDWE